MFLISAGSLGLDVNAEHPTLVTSNLRVDKEQQLALRVAADIPDDAEAVAAIRAGGGKPRVWRHAAAWLRSWDNTWEHRTDLRAARLLRAAADGGSPVPFTAEQEALIQAVERLEALPLNQAFAVLAAEVPALKDLEQQVAASLAERTWLERTADERVDEILGEAAQLVGPDASAGSPLVRSRTAFTTAQEYLLGKAGLLADDYS
jgi:hypothetical protein